MNINTSSLKFERIKSIESSSVVRKARSSYISQAGVNSISAVTGLTNIEINNYLHNRKRFHANTKKIIKFEEAVWRFLIYVAMVFLGAYALFYPEPVAWVKDTKDMWSNWPYDSVKPIILFYYIVELGLYIHFLIYTEVQRSDTIEMIIHHVLTILLIIFSHIAHWSKIGSLFLILHDTSDVFLESAKIFNYISKVKGRGWASPVCDILFAIFAITFFITRLMLYPRLVLWAAFIEGPMFLSAQFPGYIFFLSLATGLQALHIFWFYLIARMIYKLFTSGIEKDIRSDDEDDEENESETTEMKKTKTN